LNKQRKNTKRNIQPIKSQPLTVTTPYLGMGGGRVSHASIEGWWQGGLDYYFTMSENATLKKSQRPAALRPGKEGVKVRSAGLDSQARLVEGVFGEKKWKDE